MSDTEINEQQPAPDFTLPAVGSDTVVKDGKVQLSALRNHDVVLYFYPKDNARFHKRGVLVSVMRTERCRNVALSYLV